MTGRRGRLADAAGATGAAAVLALGVVCLVDLFAEVYARGLLRLRPGLESAALAAPLAAGALRRAPRPALEALVGLAALGDLAASGAARLTSAAAGTTGLVAWLFAPGPGGRPATLGAGLVLAALLGAWRQALGGARVVDAALAVVALASAIARRRGRPVAPAPASGARGPQTVSALVAAAGVAGVLALAAMVLSSPVVLACHTGVSGQMVAGTGAAAAAAWTLAARRLSPALCSAASLVFAAALFATFALHRVAFPGDPSAYPLPEPAPGPAARAALVALLALWPVVALDLAAILSAWRGARPSPRLAAAAASLCGGLVMVLGSAHVLVTIWDYVPVVGPWFRNRYPEVHLAALVPLLLAVGWARRRVPSLRAARGPVWIVALGLWATLGARAPRPAPATAGGRLRLVTWNVQQARTADGAPGLEPQAALLRDLDADVIALQESDTCRLANGNLDLVGELARTLRMRAHHGPRTVTGTFGLALLSRHPIAKARVHYLPGPGERTAVLEAEIRTPRGDLRLLVTHLGNGGPLVQQRAVLSLVPDPPRRLILCGDFNFRPGSPQYRETVARLADGWDAARVRRAEGGADPGRRIDHVFVSSDLAVAAARLAPTSASDHPVVVVDLERRR